MICVTTRGVLAVLTGLVLLARLAGCGAADDRNTAVRRVLEQAEQAAEARDVGDAMALVSADYLDSRGLDRDGLRNVVRGYGWAWPRPQAAAA